MPVTLFKIQIEIPALDALVEVIKAMNNQQAQIDALTSQVTALTASLHSSTADLQGSVDNQPTT